MSASLGPHARQCPPSGGAPSGGEFVPPAGFVARARELRCQGTSISFNEPTLNLEWSLEVFHVARAAGLDGMNVDVKGDEKAVKEYCGLGTSRGTPASTPFARIVVQYWPGEGSSGCSAATSRPTASVLDVGRRSLA